ncbi:glutathione S-transferase-like [Rhodoferax ferrireducens T118]|uniref:Glutathione S-transferase-like n=1 Tax=Albidiferax ferrireducens (strain ATCC BAA-621 / DSM 15236 / T118) TaxID=338969 RepID=Q21S23_ALBFT|nr:glutathione S-transferase [Rhodoferax ferrireducens]ABD71430.1 glutathione S-transferase-like [Rhodoferax ferrireducens T118]
MIHIWGRLSSLNVRKVVWAAQETGAPFTRSDAGMAFGVVKTPEYLNLNPNALVPTLQDGELVLWESNVIVRYLCARYAPTLYPQDLAQRFDAERWMDWQQTTLNRAGGAAFLQWIRTPQNQRDHAAIAQSVATMAPLLALLDQHLSHRAYLGGAQFSMADIPVACDIHRWVGLPQPRPPLPHLERWYASILARPAVHGVLDQPLS